MTALASSLFSSAVVTREGPLPKALPALPSDELACIATAAHVRQIDFAGGRELARSALATLGIHGFSLLNHGSGAPRWPAGVVGSITHTRRHEGGFAAVAVASAHRVRSVGIDAESQGGLTPDLWASVLREEERARLDRLPQADRVRAASLIFSAKECYYKLQYPLTGQFLNFDAAAVEIDQVRSTFRVIVRKAAGDVFREGAVFSGRFALTAGKRGESGESGESSESSETDGLVVTGMELGA